MIRNNKNESSTFPSVSHSRNLLIFFEWISVIFHKIFEEIKKFCFGIYYFLWDCEFYWGGELENIESRKWFPNSPQKSVMGQKPQIYRQKINYPSWTLKHSQP